MIKKKIQLFYKFIIQKVFKTLYGEIKIDTNVNKLFEKFHIEQISNDRHSEKKYYYYVVKNCRIYTDLNENVATIKDNIIIPDLSFQQINSKLESAKYNSVMSKGTPYIKKKLNGTVLSLLQGSSGENYFHFMFDIIPRILIFKSKNNLSEIDYFLLNKKIDWQIDILKLIGINPKKIIQAKYYRHLTAKKIICVSHPWYYEGYMQNETKNLPIWIVKELRKNFLIKENDLDYNNLKLFIDRSDSKYSHCKIINNDDVIKFLKKEKFEIIKPENFSLNEQIKKFNSAKTIIGAHGAGLTNIVFSKKGTNVIEIIPESHPSKKAERLSYILKLKYFRYNTKDTQYDKKYPFNINVDIDKLKKILHTKI